MYQENHHVSRKSSKIIMYQENHHKSGKLSCIRKIRKIRKIIMYQENHHKSGKLLCIRKIIINQGGVSGCVMEKRDLWIGA